MYQVVAIQHVQEHTMITYLGSYSSHDPDLSH